MSLLNAGSYLIERAREACPAARGNVFSTDDLAGVAEKTQVAPALHVVLYGYQPAEDDGDGTVRWDEVWLVVAVVKHAARRDRPLAQQKEAVPLVAEVLAAFSGWRLPAESGVHCRLKVVPGPRPHFSETHAYFPVALRTQPKTAGVEDDA
ncbi:MAG: hypothetical protein H3C26_07275 [Rhodocyclaceae bacterium]|nr:hypothetical protein [Rhodocyclaceae bacterium]